MRMSGWMSERMRVWGHDGARSVRAGLQLLLLALCLAPGLLPGAGHAAEPEARVLRVLVKPAQPFAFQEGGQWKGYSVDLWKAVAEKNGWRFEWVPVETVPQALEALQKKQADVAVGALSITGERERLLDFSVPFYESGLQIMARGESSGSILVALEGLLATPVWAGLLVLVGSLVVVSWLLWWLERKRNEESFPIPAKEGLPEALWWSTNVLIAGGCENKAPVGTPGRLLAVLWMLGGIAFSSYITAVFTSTLTVSNLNSQVRGVADLQGDVVATIEGSSSETYLGRLGVPTEGHDSLDSAIAALEAGDVKGVVYDMPMLRYWLVTNASRSEKIHLVGAVFDRQHYGFALPIGSERRKPINEAVLELRAEGFFDELNRRWFNETLASP